MAEVTRSRSTSLYIRSHPPYQGSMSVWALRDFVRTLDAEGVSDETTIFCHHSHETRHLVCLSVREATTEEQSEPDAGMEAGDTEEAAESVQDSGDA